MTTYFDLEHIASQVERQQHVKRFVSQPPLYLAAMHSGITLAALVGRLAVLSLRQRKYTIPPPKRQQPSAKKKQPGKRKRKKK